jgi:hypothetical protein
LLEVDINILLEVRENHRVLELSGFSLILVLPNHPASALRRVQRPASELILCPHGARAGVALLAEWCPGSPAPYLD